MTTICFLAVSPQGLRQAQVLATEFDLTTWCGADAIAEDAYHALRGHGVSRFIYPLTGASGESIAEAVATIQEHHPDSIVWVEHPFKPSGDNL